MSAAGADRLLVVHYHLQPGGVTTVIRDGLSALLASERANWLRELVVVAAGAGRRHTDPTHHDPLLQALRAAQARNRQSTTAVTVAIEPALAYRSRSRPAEQERLLQALRDRYGDALWWVHNYHLGKNTALTGAVLRAAAGGQRMLLQIHDFPECGRLDNLRQLTRDCGAHRYPRGANVGYVTINRRDGDILRGAGLPKAAVLLLPNPVAAPTSAPAMPGDAPSVAARGLLLSAQRRAWWSGRIEPERPLWLYPVRARRRKNVLEAALLATLAEANLLVTLPALSAAERCYGRVVRRAYEAGRIAGAYGIGDMPPEAGLSFDDLVQAADLVVSSSIEEGFGYAYVSALQWGRPLLARRLHVAADLGELLAEGPGLLYERVATPVTARERQDAYRAHRRVGAAAPAVTPALTPTLDFAQLPLPVQRSVLQRASEPAYRRELADANATLLSDLRRLQLPLECYAAPAARSTAPAARSVAAIDAALGPARFAERAAQLLAALRTTSGGDVSREGQSPSASASLPAKREGSIEAAVEAQFDTPETARMLVAG